MSNPLVFGRRQPAVVGYARQASVTAGQTVELCCSTTADLIDITVTRIGAERNRIARFEGVAGRPQSTPSDAAAHGCRWAPTLSIAVPETWRSGFYEVEMSTDADAEPGHAFFVVRARPSEAAPILLVLSTNTWNAYNTFGGTCMYLGAQRLSFERPIDPGFLWRPDESYDGRIASTEPAGDPDHTRFIDYLEAGGWPMWCGSSGWHNWERRFVRWAERVGFTIDVAINADLETDPRLLDPYRLMCSVGHDEYWSWTMRDAIDAFVDAGGNHAIFSGNTSFWQVRLEADRREMVGHKGSAPSTDPVRGTADAHLLTEMWSSPRVGRPETSTTGLTFTRGGYARIGRGTPRSSGAYTVHRPDHWAFADTGLQWGDSLGAGSYVVGYEVDGCAFTTVDGLPVPTHEDGTPETLTILATAPARLLSQNDEVSEIPKRLWADPDGPGDLEGLAVALFGDASPANTARLAHGHCVMASFTRGAGTVFNAGSTDWAYGLDADPLIQQVTANVLSRLTQ